MDVALIVPDVHTAAAWYARAFDGAVVVVTQQRAQLALGAQGIRLSLERGDAPPLSTTPVLELCVDDLEQWVDAAIAVGGQRVSSPTLGSYAQVRDPFGYLWAFALRARA